MTSRHGSAPITFGRGRAARPRTYDLDQIQKVIVALLDAGLVLQTQKTKSHQDADLNGRQWVTVGPHRTATQRKDVKQYRVYVGIHDLYTSGDPFAVARHFIEWVGRDLAREAVREYARNH
jgi:hypothetical protein